MYLYMIFSQIHQPILSYSSYISVATFRVFVRCLRFFLIHIIFFTLLLHLNTLLFYLFFFIYLSNSNHCNRFSHNNFSFLFYLPSFFFLNNFAILISLPIVSLNSHFFFPVSTFFSSILNFITQYNFVFFVTPNTYLQYKGGFSSISQEG